MTSGERGHSTGPADNTTPDDPSAASDQQSAAEPTTEASPSQQDEEARRSFEALAQRINDTYARFTPEEMEMVKWLGWG